MYKKQYETAFLRPLFLCKSSRLLAVTSVLPLSISFFSRLCLPEPNYVYRLNKTLTKEEFDAVFKDIAD